jgi:dCMP deaminase
MNIAKLISVLSTANRLKVGCVITDENLNNILSFGYNGTPYGDDNSCEHIVDDVMVTKPTVVHAEVNAILKLINKNIASSNVLFVTHSPCIHCATVLVQSKIISCIVYDLEYRSTDGIEYAQKMGINVIKLSEIK